MMPYWIIVLIVATSMVARSVVPDVVPICVLDAMINSNIIYELLMSRYLRQYC